MFGSCPERGATNSPGGGRETCTERARSCSASRGGDGVDEQRVGWDFGARQGDHFAEAGAVADFDVVADHRGAIDADVVADFAAGAEEDGADEFGLALHPAAAAVSVDQV